ncbi:hypothetical protein KUTeg_006360 [Tegillarca granosa]|uniref:Uncharacterized protein n=1 Tax=Tegillarca granosa TaxID=220873 RepID=A0ABQ9FJJ4_TEGGR|nr:hypothetical protein KUTeg_006360 [Tegillarca granosa]
MRVLFVWHADNVYNTFFNFFLFFSFNPSDCHSFLRFLMKKFKTQIIFLFMCNLTCSSIFKNIDVVDLIFQC